MEVLKKIFSQVDFHLNVAEKRLTIKYGENTVAFRIGEDGRLKFESNLSLDGPVMGI